MTATTTTIAHLKITLDDVKPEVLRRIEVPFNIRLDRLHLAVQAAMGWTNTHLYEIRAGDVGWGVPDPDWGDGPLDARKAHLNKVLEDVGHQDREIHLRFWRWLGPYDHDRTPDRSGAGSHLSVPD